MLLSSKPVINTFGSNVTCKTYAGCLLFRFSLDTFKMSYFIKIISDWIPSKRGGLH